MLVYFSETPNKEQGHFALDLETDDKQLRYYILCCVQS